MNYTNVSPSHLDQNLNSNKSYDFAVSLGTACIVANKMENSNLRLFSGPFDWIVGSPERVHYLIKNNFKDFFLYENLEIEGKRDGKFLVRDKLNWILSVHDFKENGNKIDTYEYKKTMEKYERRIKRFYKWCRLSEKALFIIFINSEKDFSDVYTIKEVMHNSFPQLRLDILTVFLCSEKVSEIKLMDDGIYLAHVYHDESNWPKSDLHWKNILNYFSIDFSRKTITFSEIPYLKGDCLNFKDGKDAERCVYLGLSHSEPSGRWSIGDKTRIGLKLKTRPEKMTIKCHSYKNRSSLVYVNGECVGSLDFTTNSNSHEFDIKNVNLENDCLIIDFTHETPISPLSIGESSDSREIAVCFDEIRFSQSGKRWFYNIF
jgi:Putative papain-like cysteine peptidase (DUF1796).